MPTTTAPRPLADATHLNLIRVPAPYSRDNCYAGCPTWINDAGCDCPPSLPTRTTPSR